MPLIIHGLLESAFPNWLAGLILSAGIKKKTQTKTKQKRQETVFIFFSLHPKKEKNLVASLWFQVERPFLKPEKHLEGQQLMQSGANSAGGQIRPPFACFKRKVRRTVFTL